MHTTYLGLRENPFTVTSDLQCGYVNRSSQKVYADLLSAIGERKGFLLLTGAPGTGKTTLLHRLRRNLEHPDHGVLLDSARLTPVTFDGLLDVICEELGLLTDKHRRVRQLQAFKAHLKARAQEGGTTVLLIDEAQSLGEERFRILPLLSPPDMRSGESLLQTVLVGQPEIEHKLAQPNLRQLKQRIARHWRLAGLEEDEVGSFISHQLLRVGCERQDLFTSEALQRIARYSKGIPRVINLICDHALVSASAASQDTVSAIIVDQVVHTLQILDQGEVSTPAHARGGWFRPERSTKTHANSRRATARRAALSPEEAGRLEGMRTLEHRLRVLSWRYRLCGFAILILLAIGLFYYGRAVPLFYSPALQPPVITMTEPVLTSGQALVVAEGQAVEFAIEATTAQTEPLQYVWFLDGHEQAQGARWVYQPQFDDGGSSLKAVTVRVADREHHTVERSWQVRVQNVNRPPTLVTVSPSVSSVEIAAGTKHGFSLEAVDPDTDDRLTYVWVLDGQEVAQGRTWEFAPAATAMRSDHNVTVTVLDKAGSQLTRQWTIAVAPVALQPPVITQAAPNKQTVTVGKGQKLTFVVEATSAQPEPLRYVWFLDGRERAWEPRWTYQPQFDDSGSSLKTVTVQITDRDNHTVERSWQVRVPDVNRPPTIVAASPSVRTLEIAAGEEPRFAIRATDPDKNDQLVTVWSLDGQVVARGPRWRFRQSTPSAVSTSHQVEVEVSDTGGLKSRLTWNMVMKRSVLPPRIVAAHPPDENVTTQAGEPLVFSVVAEVPGGSREASDGLRYQWTVDGRSRQATPTDHFEFRETTPARYHLVAVVISPAGAKSAPRRWTIEVRPPVGVPPSPPLLSEGEVRAWLQAHQQALEEKNVDRLVELGAITSPQADRARKILSQYRSFRVALQAVEIDLSGSRAEVRFLRVDTIDGQTVLHPDRKIFVLEKGANGRLLARPQ